MQFSTLLPLALALSAAEAVYQGFNYGSTFTDDSAKQYQDFVNEFNTAKSLVGTSGFTSARLYTMIQAGTTNTPITAIQAASDTQTSLLLGMWASGGDAGFANELQALKSAISSFPNLASSIAGLSVGSEDLYRVSPIGIENMSGVGAGPDVVTNYISQVKAALKGTSWSSVQVGHVDTWTAWVNGSNSAVVAASDFLGVDAYPYFQNTMTNDIGSAAGLFNQAISNTQGASQGKPVWITETGWPVSGPVSNLATANTANAKTYWDQVGCPNFGKVNTWWYTLQDDAPTTPSPSFGLVGNPLTTTPFYDLSCANVTNTTSSSNSTSTASSGSVPVSGGISPSGAAAAPQYANTTYTSTINGKPTTIVASTPVAATATGSATKSSTGASSSVTSYTGSATAVKGSVAGILGAIAAAVMLL